jgi:hypothetical protein
MNVAQPSELIVAEIKRRVLLFCTDNPRFANHMPAIEAAMLIGASVALELNEPPEPIVVVSDPWAPGGFFNKRG